MSATRRLAAIIPAAGFGQRMQADMPKQYLKVNGKTLLQYSVEAVLQDSRVEHVFVATQQHQTLANEDLRVSYVPGGSTRAESVLAAVLHAITQGFQVALVHDAARPGLPKEVLANVIDAGLEHDNGAIVAMPVRDSLKRSEPDQDIISTHVSREGLWQAQTPQVFDAQLLADAISEIGYDNPALTDEASAMEYHGYHPKLVMGSLKNLKVTHPEDFQLIRLLLTDSSNNQ